MWDLKVKDFGTVKKGQKLEHTFNYSGEGEVLAVSASCGCTIAQFTKKSVKAVWTTSNNAKTQSKNITVTVKERNKTSKDVLRLKATIE